MSRLKRGKDLFSITIGLATIAAPVAPARLTGRGSSIPFANNLDSSGKDASEQTTKHDRRCALHNNGERHLVDSDGLLPDGTVLSGYLEFDKLRIAHDSSVFIEDGTVISVLGKSSIMGMLVPTCAPEVAANRQRRDTSTGLFRCCDGMIKVIGNDGCNGSSFYFKFWSNATFGEYAFACEGICNTPFKRYGETVEVFGEQDMCHASATGGKGGSAFAYGMKGTNCGDCGGDADARGGDGAECR